ncbi:unnamed protein product [Adineta ricciae]|uniref:Uncharacterized protein n=1 Tax=Adineta ricciae TaxID=249248 RepID=A0A815E068_ADIRI|nr:unnamed protein product [Adineta ricciae]CAF1304646.1 unnamed protein product [Adineta ricciae]
MFQGYYGYPQYSTYGQNMGYGYHRNSAHHSQWDVITGNVMSFKNASDVFHGDEVLEVSVVDASRMDAPSITLGRQQIPLQPRQQFPIPFQFYYDKSRAGLGPGGLSMQARITRRNGQLLYINDTRTPLTPNVTIDVVRT